MLAAGVPGAQAADEPGPGDQAAAKLGFEALSYAWVPGAYGSVTVKGTTARIDATPGDVLDLLFVACAALDDFRSALAVDEAVLARLHERVDHANLEDAVKLNMQLSGLVTEREVLARVSTWPWEPTTLTGFVTTLVLPALMWAVQRVLERAGF